MQIIENNMRKLFTAFILIAVCGCFAAVCAQSDRGENKAAADDASVQQFALGALIEAQDYRGKWYPSRIADFKDGKYRVHYFGWSDDWDEWVLAKNIRVSDSADLGREVEAEQNGVWYPARIVDSKFGEYLVNYTAYDEDEWVAETRVREVGSRKGSGRPAEVLSNGRWCAAQVLDRRTGEFYVHYDGYSDAWNEWVKAERVRRMR
jgi:hypothetical protein